MLAVVVTLWHHHGRLRHNRGPPEIFDYVVLLSRPEPTSLVAQLIARVPVPEALSYECRDTIDTLDYGCCILRDTCEARAVRAKHGSVIKPGEFRFEVFLGEHLEALAKVVVEDVDVRSVVEKLNDLYEPV